MSENKTPTDTAFEGWALIELMGHRQVAGQVREVTMFGAAMLRVDIPGPTDGTLVTQYYGGGAIYAMTPCTEQLARDLIRRRSYSLPEPVLLALPASEASDFDPDGD